MVRSGDGVNAPPHALSQDDRFGVDAMSVGGVERVLLNAWHDEQ